MDTCPTIEQLEQHSLARLAESAAIAVDEHLESCVRCQDAFRKLDPIARHLKCEFPTEILADDSGLDSLIARVVEVCETASGEVDVTLHEPAASRNALDLRRLLSPAEDKDEIGRLDGFRVTSILGEGGMGVVLAGEDVTLRRRVAIKVMRPVASDARPQERFLREMRAVAAIDHDHVVPIYHVGNRHGIPYFVMKHLQGKALSDQLNANPRLPLAEAVRIARETALGLEAAHATGVIHRDIKPDNLWLEEPSGRVRILDFGLARDQSADAEVTSTGEVLGTPAYLSPEQINGEPVTPATDLFSLGVVLYRMLTGKPPFVGKTIPQLMVSISTRNPELPSQQNSFVSTALDELVMQLLQKAPDRRPGTAREVTRRLDEIAAEIRAESKPLVPPTSGVPARAQRSWPSRFSWSKIAMATGLAAILLTIITIAFHRPEATVFVQLETAVEIGRIELDGSAVSFEVDDAGNKLRLRVPKGSHRIQLFTPSGVELETDVGLQPIEIGAAGTTIRAWREKNASAPAATSDSSSAAAQLRDLPRQPEQAPTRWHPGPGYPEVAGLLPAPAQLQGMPAWNIRNRLPVATVSAQAAPYACDDISICQGGKSVTWVSGGAVYVADLASGAVNRVIPIASTLEAVSVDSDARRLAIVELYGATVWIVDRENNVVQTWKLANNSATTGRIAVRWMPDDQRLLVWDRSKAQIVNPDQSVVFEIVFPEGGGPSYDWRGYRPLMAAVSVNSKGDAIAFGCADGRIRVWKPETGELTVFDQVPHEKQSNPFVFSTVAWSPDDALLVSAFARIDVGNQSIRLWRADGTPGTERGTHAGWGLTWSPNGQYLVTGNGHVLRVDGDTAPIRELPVREGTPTRRGTYWQPVWTAATRIDFVAQSAPGLIGIGAVQSFSPTGRRLPIASFHNPLSPRQVAWLDRARSSRPSVDGVSGSSPVDSDSFRSDFGVVYSSGSQDGDVTSTVHRFRSDGSHVERVSLQDRWGELSMVPETTLLRRKLQSNSIALSDYRGKEVGRIEYEPDARVSAVEPSVDGSVIAMLVEHPKQVFVDLRKTDGTPLRQLELEHRFAQYNSSIRWSPDGTWVAIAGAIKDGLGAVVIWHPETSTKPVARFSLPTRPDLSALYWSPGSSWIACFGDWHSNKERTVVRLWHTPTKRQFKLDDVDLRMQQPVWLSDTQLRLGQQLFTLSPETPNAIEKSSSLPFAVTPLESAPVFMATNADSIIYRLTQKQPLFPIRSELEIWQTNKNVGEVPLHAWYETRRMSPTRNGQCLLMIGAAEHGLTDAVALFDAKRGQIGFVMTAYDDGATLSLSPAGEILEGPEDVDPYLMYVLHYPGGAEIALNRAEFNARIGQDAAHEAMNWVLDIGGALQSSDSDRWHKRGSTIELNPALIEAVDLSGVSAIADESLARLAALPALREVDVSRTSTGTAHFAGISSLEKLSLSRTSVRSVGDLSGMRQLRELDLSGTQIDSAIGKTLLTLLDLTRLDLSNTRIDEFLLPDLAELKALQRLDLTGVALPERAIRDLKSSLPNCEISHGTATKPVRPQNDN